MFHICATNGPSVFIFNIEAVDPLYVTKAEQRIRDPHGANGGHASHGSLEGIMVEVDRANAVRAINEPDTTGIALQLPCSLGWCQLKLCLVKGINCFYQEATPIVCRLIAGISR